MRGALDAGKNTLLAFLPIATLRWWFLCAGSFCALAVFVGWQFSGLARFFGFVLKNWGRLAPSFRIVRRELHV
jgi:hypothetical protein